MILIFEDKTGRTIKIEVSGDKAEAFHGDRQIGFVEASGREDGDNGMNYRPAQITGWEVDVDYRRAGIATAMVRALVVELGQLLPAPRNTGISGKNSLTNDGEQITIYCQSEGLILPHPAIDPDGDERYA